MSWREAGLSDWKSVGGVTSAVFLDRDGVINVDHGYVSTWEQFDFLPGVPGALRELQDAGYLLIVVSY